MIRKVIITVVFLLSVLLVCFLFKSTNYLKQPNVSSNKVIEKTVINNFSFGFIENKGQCPDSVLFYNKSKKVVTFICRNKGIYYWVNTGNKGNEYLAGFVETTDYYSESTPIGAEKKPHQINVFKGQKQDTGINCYGSVLLGKVAPGINMALKVNAGRVEKIFTLQPGANLANLKMLFKANSKLKLNNNGELVLKSNNGTLNFTKPVAFQQINGEKQNVEIAYNIADNSYGFEVGEYNTNYPLIIDPLINSTYLGGMGYETIKGIKQDNEGNIFICGVTTSLDFPITENAFMPDLSYSEIPTEDVFVVKFNSNLTKLLCATFLGGWTEDYVDCIDIADNGNVFLGGLTRSNDFPTTINAFSKPIQDTGRSCAFISCLNNDLSQLVASTCILYGESVKNHEYCNCLKVVNDTNIYFGGVVTSIADSFPRWKGYACLGKFNKDLSKLKARFIDGDPERESRIMQITTDMNKNIVVSGWTRSEVFPVTNNAYQPKKNNSNSNDAFVAIVSPDLDTIKHATYWGCAGSEYTDALWVSNEGKIYLSGTVDTVYYGESDFPISLCFDSTLSELVDSIFGVRFSFYSNGYFYSTYDMNAKDHALGAYRSRFQEYVPTLYYRQYDYSIHKYSADLKTELLTTYVGPVWIPFGYFRMAPLNNGNILFAMGTHTDTLELTDSSVFTQYYGGEYGIISPVVGDCYIAILDGNLSDSITALYASADTGGLISPAGMFKIADSLTMDFNIIPNEGYEVEEVFVDHKSVGIIDSYSFENAKEDHYIHATFAKKPVSITEDLNRGIKLNCYPVPFHNELNISYSLTTESKVTFHIYNLGGSLVDVVQKGKQTAGEYMHVWNNQVQGKKLNKGVYFIVLQINNKTYSKKVLYQ